MRDRQNNFKASIRQKLRDRAGNICSNPSCYAPTSGAKAGEDGALDMGVGAHICAASPLGPRYNADMTPKQRSAYENGIWLCTPCSIKIDKDFHAYPEELLREWKRNAEKRSNSRIGIPAIPDSAPQDLLVTALHGAPLKSGIAQAISNVHSAVETVLSSLDNRFQIQSSHNLGQTTYRIAAREHQNIDLTVEFKNPQRYAKDYQRLIEEGKSLTIDTSDINLKGSPLFEKITAESSKLQIGSLSKPCTVRVSTVHEETGHLETFNDIEGNFSYGTKGGTFTGLTMGKMLKFEFDINFKELDKFNIKITPLTDLWSNTPIDSLPYFSKIKNLLLNINSGHTLNITAEYQGEQLFSGKSHALSFKGQFDNIKMLFLYLDAAREISKKISSTILFKDNQHIPSEDIEKLIKIASMMNHKYFKEARNLSKPIRFKLKKEKDSKKQIEMLEKEEDLQLRITQEEGDTISILGQKIKLPRQIIELNCARIKITNKKENLKNSMLECEIVPRKNFSLKIFYSTEV